MPPVKISKDVTSTSASITNATTISISVKPDWARFISILDRDPAREPVHVHEVLALAGGNRDASTGGAPVGIEADPALALARDLRGRGVELEVDALWQLARRGLAGQRVF